MAYRILSLDGGGTWALIQVMALIRLYNSDTKKGHEVLADFDMAAANSGGAIVLGALLEDLSLGQIRDYFLDIKQRQSLFSTGGTSLDDLLHLADFGPKYATKPKLLALERLMPKTGLTAMNTVTAGLRGAGGDDLRVLIVGFDYDRERAVFFRSRQSGGPAWGNGDHAGKVTLAEAIHASSTAPVNYFDEPATFETEGTSGRYWDGGVTGQNNPVLAAVVEAVQAQQDPRNISALSIGTGTVCLPDAADPNNPKLYESTSTDPSLVNDLKKLAKSILDDPPDAASFIAHMMTYTPMQGNQPNPVSRIVRISPLIAPLGKPGNWSLPGGISPAQFRALLNVPMDAITDADVQSIKTLAESWLDGRAYNQAIRMDRGTWTWELGHQTAPEAFKTWRAIANLAPVGGLTT